MADPKKPTDDEEVDLTPEETDQTETSESEAENSDLPDIEDAEIVEAGAETAEDAMDDIDAALDDATDAVDEDVSLLDQVEPDGTPLPEPEPEIEPAAVAAPAEKSSGAGFGALLLGGVLAAAIGVGAAKYILPQSWFSDQSGTDELSATLQAQDEQIATLSANMSELSASVQDPAATDALAEQIESLNLNLTGRLDKLAEDLSAQSIWLGEIDERLSVVEKAPLKSSNDASVAAYERELEKMRTALETQQAENDRIAADVSTIADQARADIDAASERAQELETRAAVLRIQAALDTGGGFASALKELNVEVPEALTAVADNGVASLSDLQDGFPDAAREGLEASLHATAGEDPVNRVGAFLRGQFGVRSLQPREGDDPDAILSRAEAALGSGDINGALAEIVMLPPDGQSAMTDWVTQARARLDAAAAVESLAETLNIN